MAEEDDYDENGYPIERDEQEDEAPKSYNSKLQNKKPWTRKPVVDRWTNVLKKCVETRRATLANPRDGLVCKIGSRARVVKGTAEKFMYGKNMTRVMKRNQLVLNKYGKYVSRKRSEAAKKRYQQQTRQLLADLNESGVRRAIRENAFMAHQGYLSKKWKKGECHEETGKGKCGNALKRQTARARIQRQLRQNEEFDVDDAESAKMKFQDTPEAGYSDENEEDQDLNQGNDQFDLDQGDDQSFYPELDPEYNPDEDDSFDNDLEDEDNKTKTKPIAKTPTKPSPSQIYRGLPPSELDAKDLGDLYNALNLNIVSYDTRSEAGENVEGLMRRTNDALMTMKHLSESGYFTRSASGDPTNPKIQKYLARIEEGVPMFNELDARLSKARADTPRVPGKSAKASSSRASVSESRELAKRNMMQILDASKEDDLKPIRLQIKLEGGKNKNLDLRTSDGGPALAFIDRSLVLLPFTYKRDQFLSDWEQYKEDGKTRRFELDTVCFDVFFEFEGNAILHSLFNQSEAGDMELAKPNLIPQQFQDENCATFVKNTASLIELVKTVSSAIQSRILLTEDTSWKWFPKGKQIYRMWNTLYGVQYWTVPKFTVTNKRYYSFYGQFGFDNQFRIDANEAISKIKVSEFSYGKSLPEILSDSEYKDFYAKMKFGGKTKKELVQQFSNMTMGALVNQLFQWADEPVSLQSADGKEKVLINKVLQGYLRRIINYTHGAIELELKGRLSERNYPTTYMNTDFKEINVVDVERSTRSELILRIA